MKLLLGSLMMTLAACAAPAVQSPATAPAPVTTPAPAPIGAAIARAGTVILTGERAFAVAELGYLTAADGVGRLVSDGVIHGDTAAQVRGWNAEARRWLVRGHAASDAAEKARASTALFGLTDKLNALRGK